MFIYRHNWREARAHIAYNSYLMLLVPTAERLNIFN